MQFTNYLRRIGAGLWNAVKNTGRFLISKVFLVNISIAIGILLIIFIGISSFLKAYTHHGEALSVPDFRGLTMQEVEELARQKNLEYEVIDSVYNFTGRKGTVVDQTPPPDFKVKEGRTIFLTRQKYRRARVEVPSFVDLSAFQARADIQSLDLRVNHINYVQSKFHNLVLGQRYKGDTLRAGAKLPKGTGITLVIGKKEEAKTQIPSFVGLTTRLATSKALDFSLNIGQVYYDHTVRTKMDTVNAKVWRQEPSAGTKNVPLGRAVDIYTSLSEAKLEVGKLSDDIQQ